MSTRSPFDRPTATYRLQLNRDFTFDQARQILPYLARLGISHVYCSPCLKARAGSTHGYDVVDYDHINPELGGEAGFERFCAELQERNLGLILDFVPNHMGVGHADNSWWLDVLEWGEASPYGRYFDIEWSPPRHELAGRLLLPILGKSYGAALSAGEIALRFDTMSGTFDFWYFDHRLPLSPRDYAEVLGPLANALVVGRGILSLGALFQVRAESADLRKAAAEVKEALAATAYNSEMERAIEAAAASWSGKVGEPQSFARMHELLQRQAYRLAHWHTASDEINYRRFFDIDDLAGIRVDRITVFRDVHRRVGRLLARGVLHGLRIDHVDGLADPQRYCRRLNAFAAAIVPREAEGRRLRPYILVEKILTGDEKLSTNWPVSGTTGYDYLALVNGLFIESAGYAKLQRHWSRFTGVGFDQNEAIYNCRRLVIDRSFSSELTYLVDRLVEIAEGSWFTRDFTRKRLHDALTEIVAAFPVYRTYVTERGADEIDRRTIEQAVGDARARWVGADGEILDFIGSVLNLDIARSNPAYYAAKKQVVIRFIARMQQYTGAIAAMAIENTLFYRYAPLASANEVGATVFHPATSLMDFHARIGDRASTWPHAMLASATHDTKWGEDSRVRLDVLSEIPDEWARRVARWHVYNRVHRDGAAPSLNDEYLLYQGIVGTWPTQPGGLFRSTALLQDYCKRLKAYAIKACREAKLESSWTAPNESYESAFATFIDRIFDQPRDSRFIDSLLRFLPPVLRLGAANGLSQLVLKATLPGVPDFYQGSEFWDLSLVDPDNRRPVVYQIRIDALAAIDFATAQTRWRDGWLKLWVTWRLLEMRNRFPDLFFTGNYEPLTVEGPDKDCIIAFQRRSEHGRMIVLVSRMLAAKLRGNLSMFWPRATFSADTAIRGASSGRWCDQITGAGVEGCSRGIAASEALAALPVAVLYAD